MRFTNLGGFVAANDLAACCARAASGHAAAVPPMSAMKSRRLIFALTRSPALPGYLDLSRADERKVQRKVSNGIAGLAAAGASRHRQKIAAIPASASILPRSWH